MDAAILSAPENLPFETAAVLQAIARLQTTMSRLEDRVVMLERAQQASQTPVVPANVSVDESGTAFLHSRVARPGGLPVAEAHLAATDERVVMLERAQQASQTPVVP